MKKHILVFFVVMITAFPLFAQSELRLEPAGDTGEDDLFGGNVAMSGDTMVVSGQGADSATIPDSGAVFVFQRSGNQWLQSARLMASDARNRDDFGANVGISEDGNTIIVAADQQTNTAVPPQFGFQAGAVYVFQRVNDSWIQQAELTSPAPARNAGFGFWGMAISGDTIAVGDAGGFANGFTPVVDIFTRTNDTWQQTATLEVPENFSFFPQSISMSGNTLVVSSTDPTVSIGGAAYVFERQDGSWTRQGTLVPNDASFGTNFGWSVSVRGNLIAVGTTLAPGASQESGAVYVFARRDGGWSQQAKLVATDGADFDAFGQSVSVFGNTVVAGAPFHGNGSAYVYRSHGTDWSLISELSASDGVPGGVFGDSVSLRDNTLLIGSAGQHPEVETGAGYPGGEAYVYRLNF